MVLFDNVVQVLDLADLDGRFPYSVDLEPTAVDDVATALSRLCKIFALKGRLRGDSKSSTQPSRTTGLLMSTEF